MFIWLLSAQYAAPVLRNSIDKIAVMDIASILERVMKLSTISLIIWLAGFFALFQALLNALAEVMQFGDREFYTDWWNSSSLGVYWRSWNRPVYLFMKRHVFSPLVGRGWSPLAASGMVFTLSAVLHEMLVGIPTHNFIGMFLVSLLALTGTYANQVRCCILWNDVPAAINRPYCAIGEGEGASRQGYWKLYLLG
jgi:diacylglycerol O-acyltransferase-1